jgi:Na+/H+ antiporter NhaC
MKAVVGSVKYQFYGILTILLVFANALGIVPDFGPMRKAELRAKNTGKVVADGDVPMLSSELDEIKPRAGWKSNVFLHFLMPAFIVVGVALWTWNATGSAKVLESFMVAVAYQAIILLCLRAFTISEMMATFIKGIKSVMWAVLILGMAYMINGISKTLGTSDYVISLVQSWITPSTLFMLTFLVSAFMSFFTGTSWGVYAIMIPIVIPLALNMSGGEINDILFATVAAVMGGGCFGDHCSPLSDTTILSSLGAGSDLVAHVKTQLPYALIVAVVCCALYMVIGV